MSQERLDDLVLMAIENELLEKVDYDSLIDDFASKHVRRMILLK